MTILFKIVALVWFAVITIILIRYLYNRAAKSKAVNILHSFMSAWKTQKWHLMYSFCQTTWCHNHPFHKDGRLFLQDHYRIRYLKEWKIISKEIISTTCIKVWVKITFGSPISGAGSIHYHNPKTIIANIIRESKPYTTSVKGKWGVNPISVLKEVKI